jgi:hypothetical protein
MPTRVCTRIEFLPISDPLACHSERSEESAVSNPRILRCAQNDRREGRCWAKTNPVQTLARALGVLDAKSDLTYLDHIISSKRQSVLECS